MQPSYPSPHLGLTYESLTDPDTVARNWRGEITPEQEKRVRLFIKIAWQSGIMACASVAIFLIIAATVFINFRPALQTSPSSPIALWFPMGIFVLLFLVIETVSVTSALRSWRQIRLMTDDLETRRIATGEGEVVWGRGQYGFKMYVAKLDDGRTLQTPAHSLQLPPGRYRYAYLAESLWLLSAESLADPAASDTPRMPVAGPVPGSLAIIARQHGFTLADLEANRRGQLSARQRQGLLLKGLGMAVGALCALLLAGTMTIDMVLPGAIGRLVLSPEPGGIFLVVLIWLGFIWLVSTAASSFGAAMSPSPLRSQRGPLTVRYESAYRSVRVFYVVGSVKCELSSGMLQRQAYNSVIEGKPYCIYYLANSHILLSLEPLEA